MTHKLLIVDDEEDILHMLQLFFTERGYQVQTADSARTALQQIAAQPELILLDVNMPDMDGLALCATIRDHVNCPILFISAKIEESDKLAGFRAGGDDYILKPFSLLELEARIAAHLRREQRHGRQTQIQFKGDLLIDYLQRQLYFKNQPLPLTKKEFAIVELLSQNPGQVFDKERIYERIWGWDSEGDSSVVAEHIRRIRAKFCALGCMSYIETVWGCGYKWIK